MSGESELVIVEEPSSPPNESPEVKERFRAPSSGHFVVTTDEKWPEFHAQGTLAVKLRKKRLYIFEKLETLWRGTGGKYC